MSFFSVSTSYKSTSVQDIVQTGDPVDSSTDVFAAQYTQGELNNLQSQINSINNQIVSMKLDYKIRDSVNKDELNATIAEQALLIEELQNIISNLQNPP